MHIPSSSKPGGGGYYTQGPSLSPMLNVFLGSIFSHFPLVPTSMAVSWPTGTPNSTWWVGGVWWGGEKPDGGFRVERWGGPSENLTLLLFTYLVHAYGHGLQRKQGAELGKRKGGGASLIWGAKHKSNIGGGGQRPIMGGLEGWGLGVMVHKSLKSKA